MEFKFAGSLWIEEEELEEMKKKVKEGGDLDVIFDDWKTRLEDADFYVADYAYPEIIKYITEGANPNA